MPEVHILAVLAGAVAAFGLGAAYYGVLGERLAEAAAAPRRPSRSRPGRSPSSLCAA